MDTKLMMDKILASVSVLALIAFTTWVAYRVMEPDLWIVSILIVSVGIYFVWDEIRAGGSHFEDELHTDKKDG